FATGSVAFYEGSTLLGSVPLSTSLYGGWAKLMVPAWAAGSHPLTAVYSGDPGFVGSTSPATIQTTRPDPTTTSVVATSSAPVAALLSLGYPASILNSFGNGGGMAVDAAGNLFVADTSNNVIREVRADGTIVTVAGDGTFGYGGDGGPASVAQLAWPTALALD